jgi:adenylate cyclase
MGKEIERKFLVNGEFIHLAKGRIEIIQTYLSIDPEKTIRIRISDDKAYLTIKGKPGQNSLVRAEWNIPLTYTDAGEIMSLCLPGKVVKTRYLVPSGKHTVEVDVFHDKNEGLVIAEIELSEESEPFDHPDWLGSEVTGDPRYYSANLIK